MSDITKKYVDYAGLQEYDSQIKGVISTDFVGATSSSDGAAGRVPAPESGDENKYLRGDGTWSTVGGSGGGSVTGVKGDAETTYRDGNVNITPANIGLGNVNNTSDANKPVSIATENELNVLRRINAFNVLPYTTVKNTTIGGVTITNNLDGSYTISGSTSDETVIIDLISGKMKLVQEGSTRGTLVPVLEPFHVSPSGAFKMSIGCENPAAAASCRIYVEFMDKDFSIIKATAVQPESGIRTYTFTPELLSVVKYARYTLDIYHAHTFNNITVFPAIWDAASSITALKPGTMAEWNALSDYTKGLYQIVILTEDD